MKLNALLLILILGVALFFRIYKLDTLMPFIPDQGWFYLSARDMLLTGHIPLVGPSTSHPWIHHGPLWTYTLAALLYAGKFNPIFPAYYIAILGAITTWLLYYVTTKMFSRTTGLLVAFLWATSPLIILNARIPYHTSPIPFFVIILFYLTYLWVKGRVRVFPLIVFILAVLYNHEITTFIFDITISIILLFGVIKRKPWATQLLSKKIIFLSVLLFTVPMIPFLLYDINNGYKQTAGFGVWVIYRLIKVPMNFIHPNVSAVASPTLSASLPEFFSYFQQLIFMPSLIISLGVLIGAFLYGLLLLKHEIFMGKYKKQQSKEQIIVLKIGTKLFSVQNALSIGQTLLLLFLGIAIPGLFLHRVPIEADILLVSPFFILLIALMFVRLMQIRYFKVSLMCVVILFGVINTYTLLSTRYLTVGDYGRLTIEKQTTATDRVISIAKGYSYNIKGRGELSAFPVFLTPYKYLLWLKGHPDSDRNEKIQILIWEKESSIFVEKKK